VGGPKWGKGCLWKKLMNLSKQVGDDLHQIIKLGMNLFGDDSI